MAQLSVCLLGGFEVFLNGEAVTAFEYDKVRALLAFLAVEATHAHRREALAGLLWPERPETAARQNLSQALFALRRAIGDHTATPPFLLITPQTLQFNTASHYEADVTTFSDLMTTCQRHEHRHLDACSPCLERLQQAVALYRGHFLAGLSIRDSVSFEEWAILHQERYHHLTIEALRHLAHHFETDGDYEMALQYAWREVELEPWQEEAHRQVMRLLTWHGERGAALAQYEACRQMLRAELDVEPAAETAALYQQIRDGTLGRTTSESSVSTGRIFASVSSSGGPGEFAETVFSTLRFCPLGPLQPGPSFVARQRELDRLNRFLATALTGQGQVVFVTGEAGCGKTMLLQAFARQAQAKYPALIVVGGQGNAFTGLGDPYLPFREVLRQLSGDVEAGVAAGAINRESARRLWNLLPVTAHVLLEVGPDLIGTFLPGPPFIERTRAAVPQPGEAAWLSRLESLVSQKNVEAEPPSQPPSNLFEQYAHVLNVLTGHQPLLLLLDDLQWVDLASVNLLFYLARQLAGRHILLVGAYRPEEIIAPDNGKPHPLEPVVNEFKGHFGAIEVDLSQADGRQFVNAFLDIDPNRLDDPFRQTLYRQTGGHPLFTVELLHEMQKRGDLIQEPAGRWVEGATLNWTILPPQVEASIAERIGRLTEDLRDLLTIASIEGETFTAEVVARVQGVAERKTVRRLSATLGRKHRLVTAREIRQVAGQQLSLYRFRHILFQHYLYQQLDPAERVYLHRAVGTALESLYGAQTEEIAAPLARHFQAAHHFEKAVDYLLIAGERALKLHAYHEASQYFATVGQLLPKLRTTTGERQRRLSEGLKAIGAAQQRCQ